MKIFKNIDETCPVSETSFKRTLDSLARANWNKTYSSDSTLDQYHGYSDKNMAKAVNAKWPYCYSHYSVQFLTSRRLFIENNQSSGWLVVFDTVNECKRFKQNVFKKFFKTASQRDRKAKR